MKQIEQLSNNIAKVMKQIEQLRNNIAKVMGTIKDVNGVAIKGWETKTIFGAVKQEPIGFAITIELDNNGVYRLNCIALWAHLLDADDCTISARNNQLKVKFNIKL